MKKYILIAGALAFLISAAAVTLIPDAGNAQDKAYRIGDRGPAGGLVFYDKKNSSGGWRYLEAAPEDLGTATWGCNTPNGQVASEKGIGAGRKNTEAIIKDCDKEEIAAKMAAGYRGGGRNDWFLPSRDELDIMYKNLHNHKEGRFADASYWSSTEKGEHTAYIQSFCFGDKFDQFKDLKHRVRPIRAF